MIRSERVRNHFGLALFTAAGCYLTMLAAPHMGTVRQLTIGWAYVSLILLMWTLAIGPWRTLRRQKRTPLNINLRRDAGIWVAATAVVHILGTFYDHHWGIWNFFLWPDGSLRLNNLFGSSNYVGAAAG